MGLWRNLKILLGTIVVSSIIGVVGVVLVLVYVERRHPNHILFDLIKVKDVLLGKEVLLRDYLPEMDLRVKETPITKARFPVIDVNTHLSDSPLSADALIEVMDQVGVRRVLNHDGGWGDDLRQSIAKYDQVHPGRFNTLTNTHFLWSEPWKIGSPNYSQSIENLIRDAASQGAIGMKVWKDVGLKIWDTERRRVPYTDERLKPLWGAARSAGFFLIFHVGDPTGHFKPIGPTNERYLSLTQQTGEGGYIRPWLPPKFPQKTELLEEFEALVKQYPDLTFNATHMAMAAEDLEFLGGLLDRNPNLVVDISTQVDELGRQPNTSRRFITRYQDRVLFGTDGGKYWDSVEDAVRVYRTYFRFLETDDDYFDYPLRDKFIKGNWKVYGLALPDSVLEKVYYKNAERVLGNQLGSGAEIQ